MTTAVKLKFVDATGAPLDDHNVVVDIFSLDNTRHFQAVVHMQGQTDVTINLQDCRSGIYRLQLWPTNYQLLQFFFSITEGQTNVRDRPAVFPVDPNQVIGIAAPSFDSLDTRLQKLVAGAAQYDALAPRRKAALLNLFTKSSNTILDDSTSCFDHLHAMVELDQDRLFATTEAALLEEAAQSHRFHSADFSLHKEIPPFRLTASFKTLEAHGNLQLTFSRNPNAANDYLVDMDIDEAQGLEHIFEVLKNAVTGLTDPYNVREILAAAQNLKPLYSFQFAQKGAAAVVTGAGG